MDAFIPSSLNSDEVVVVITALRIYTGTFRYVRDWAVHEIASVDFPRHPVVIQEAYQDVFGYAGRCFNANDNLLRDVLVGNMLPGFENYSQYFQGNDRHLVVLNTKMDLIRSYHLGRLVQLLIV